MVPGRAKKFSVPLSILTRPRADQASCSIDESSFTKGKVARLLSQPLTSI